MRIVDTLINYFKIKIGLYVINYFNMILCYLIDLKSVIYSQFQNQCYHINLIEDLNKINEGV